jgi:hypothetical protein
MSYESRRCFLAAHTQSSGSTHWSRRTSGGEQELPGPQGAVGAILERVAKWPDSNGVIQSSDSNFLATQAYSTLRQQIERELERTEAMLLE